MSETPKQAMEAVVKQKSFFEARCEKIALNAKLMRACYESCRKEGFSVNQSMSMMMERGPDLIFPDCNCDNCGNDD